MVVAAAALLLSVIASTSSTLMPRAWSSPNASRISSKLLALWPMPLLSLPEESARLRRMLRKAVAALEASKPLLAKTPKKAAVSLVVRPKLCAIGATMEMDVASLLKSKADALVDLAITSSRVEVSLARKPNALMAEPVKSAALARSVPTALANLSTEPCIAMICLSLKPRRARAVCSSVTLLAVNSVVRPSCLALSVSACTSALVLPRTEARVELARSKPAIVLTAELRPLMTAMRLVHPPIILVSSLVVLFAKFLTDLRALAMPASKLPLLRPSFTKRLPILAIGCHPIVVRRRVTQKSC